MITKNKRKVILPGVELVTHPRSSSAGPALPLLCRRLANPCQLEHGGIAQTVVSFLLDFAAVDDAGDVVDCERSLGDVGGKDDLPEAVVRRSKNELLVLSRHLGVKHQNQTPLLQVV